MLTGASPLEASPLAKYYQGLTVHGALMQVAFELFAMHYVEVRRAYDFKNPGSQDQDPIFKNYSLPKHEVGYPGGIFAPVVPGDARMCATM